MAGKKLPPMKSDKNTPEWNEEKIARDNAANPNKSFMGGPSHDEAKEKLKDKFGYTEEEIKKLTEAKKEVEHRPFESFDEFAQKELVKEAKGQSLDELRDRAANLRDLFIEVEENGEEKEMTPEDLLDYAEENELYDPSTQPVPDDIPAKKLRLSNLDGSKTLSFNRAFGGPTSWSRPRGQAAGIGKKFWVDMVQALSATS